MNDSIYILNDVYERNKKKYDQLAEITGQRICTVDLQAGYVAPKVDKWGQDDETGEYTEQNIRERFDLKTPDNENPESEDGKNYESY